MDDPYAVLGVPRDATAGAIRKAFRALSLRYHPDKNVTIIVPFSNPLFNNDSR